eukprot:7340283-Heterocapsa_arctica.AAC.1
MVGWCAGLALGSFGVEPGLLAAPVGCRNVDEDPWGVEAVPRLLEARTCRAWPWSPCEGFSEIPVDSADDCG